MSQRYIKSSLRSSSWKAKTTCLLLKLICIELLLSSIKNMAVGTISTRGFVGANENCKVYKRCARVEKENAPTGNRGILGGSWERHTDGNVSVIVTSHDLQRNAFMGCHV